MTALELSGASTVVAQEPAEVFNLAPSPDKPVYSYGVIDHTRRPEQVLQQIKSSIESGSAVSLMAHHRRSWEELWILLTCGKGQFWRLSGLFAGHFKTDTDCPVTCYRTKKKFSTLLASQVWKVREALVERIPPYRIPEYAQYECREVQNVQRVCALFRWIEKPCGWHLCMTAEAI